jgi:hypothetical protein
MIPGCFACKVQLTRIGPERVHDTEQSPARSMAIITLSMTFLLNKMFSKCTDNRKFGFWEHSITGPPATIIKIANACMSRVVIGGHPAMNHPMNDVCHQ